MIADVSSHADVIALREAVCEAAATRTALRIRAGGTKDFYGNATTGSVLDPRSYCGVVAYEPSELVITARAGTPLTELENTLAAHGQMLAFEPPHFGSTATLGGCIAAGLAGPRRTAYGPCYGGVRDFVLGARMLDGRGEVLTFGGSVMKNVAGYDLARMLVGSLGVLGVILEVSVKVLPQPTAQLTLSFELQQQEALDRLNAWAGQPLPLSASVWHEGVLSVRLSGSRAAVADARSRLGGEMIEASGAERVLGSHPRANASVLCRRADALARVRALDDACVRVARTAADRVGWCTQMVANVAAGERDPRGRAAGRRARNSIPRRARRRGVHAVARAIDGSPQTV